MVIESLTSDPSFKVGSIHRCAIGDSAPADDDVIPTEITRSSVTIDECLGHGAFGTVHKAIFAPEEGATESTSWR